jgi:TRAP-type transport system small permease protein
MENLLKAWNAVTRYSAWVGGAALIVLMAVTVIDIAGRNAGVLYLQGVIELSNVTVVCLGMLGLGYCFAMRGHIVVDLATMGAPPRFNRALDTLWLIVGAAVLGVMAMLMWGEGWSLHASGEVSDNLHWSPLVFYIPAAAGAAIAALTCGALAGAQIFGPGANDSVDAPAASREDTERSGDIGI